MEVCPDCVLVGERQPDLPAGNSIYCLWHRRAREQHNARHRQAVRRARVKSGNPKHPGPKRKTYTPQLLEAMRYGVRDRQVSVEDVQYLDDLITAVRRSKGALDTAIATKTRLDATVLVALNRDLGVLLSELDKVLFPDGPPPARKRRILKNRYKGLGGSGGGP